MTDKRFISWEEVDGACQKLAHQLKDYNLQKMLVVTRGGLVPAGILSQHLNIKYIETIGLQSYRGETQTELAVVKNADDGIGKGEGCLILDELIDTGATVEYLQEKYPKAIIATLYEKPSGHGMSNETAHQLDMDAWLVFPWEAQE